MDTRAELRTFFKRRLSRDIKDDDLIFVSGYVSSMFSLELIMFIEATFGVTVENSDLERTNFESVQAISLFVERKTNGR